MSHGIRNWSAAIFLLGLGAAAGWLLRGTPPRPDMPPPVQASAAPLRAPIAPAADGKHGASASPRSPLAKKPEENPWPPAGESLTFTAHLSKLNNVAALRLLAGERSDFLGKKSIHLQALANTQNPLRMVFELDDRFDSYSETAGWTSQQYEMHLSERGQKQSIVLRLSSGAEPAPAGMTAARVLPGTRDPLGMIYYLRKVDWTKTEEVRSPVYDGRKLYEVRARLAGQAEKVKVPAGEFQALKIAVQVFENGKEFKDASFVVYLAAAGAAGAPTPVLLEAVLPIGNARVELISAK
ncbi:MAG: DUF3108 domain-containing protein [Acidobacteriia bacterium]|nr:DUF3108 domain-containing protein [Terriglobia bacterium]